MSRRGILLTLAILARLAFTVTSPVAGHAGDDGASVHDDVPPAVGDDTRHDDEDSRAEMLDRWKQEDRQERRDERQEQRALDERRDQEQLDERGDEPSDEPPAEE